MTEQPKVIVEPVNDQTVRLTVSMVPSAQAAPSVNVAKHVQAIREVAQVLATAGRKIRSNYDNGGLSTHDAGSIPAGVFAQELINMTDAIVNGASEIESNAKTIGEITSSVK